MKKIDPNKFLQGKKRKPTVIVPSKITFEGYCLLWGYHIDETETYNIVEIEPVGYLPQSLDSGDDLYLWEKRHRLRHYVSDCKVQGLYIIGVFGKDTHTIPEYVKERNAFVYGCLQDDVLTFHESKFDIDFDGDGLGIQKCILECEVETYQLKMDIFSRNTGILESDIMLKKGALIIGCGSVGSLVALELARAGVGRFFLVDMDILGYHNICRHQCGIQDVGKYKTTAIKERILQINPTAQIITEHKRIQDIALNKFEEFCNEDTIVVGCADNREGDLYADTILAKQYKMPFVSIGCWERAFAGEIFYCLPEGMPAYKDFVAALGESSGRTTANTHLYMGEVGTFEPGISVDINFVTTIAVKMILDLLNRENEGYTQRLLPSLTQYTLICNTNNPKIGGDMAEIFSYPLQVTTSIEVEYAEPEKNE